jgi:hypothetical protein
MASITTINGTDSLSTSRVVINDNFSALDSGLDGITALLDTTGQNLTLSGSMTGSSLTLTASNTNRFVVSSTQIVNSLPATFEGQLIIEDGIRYSTVSPTILPAANSYEYSTFILSSTTFSGTNVLAAGDEGQEITLIASGGGVDIDHNNIAGVTALISMADNGTLTLRYIGASWYVISFANTTVTY